MLNKASQFASKLAGLISLAFAGKRYTMVVLSQLTNRSGKLDMD
jgi:hypothetical protein